MKKHIRVIIPLVLFATGLLGSLNLQSSLIAFSSASAQEADPIQEVQSFIAQGEAGIKKASARNLKGKRRTKKRVVIYLSALKSFSSALRKLNEYQIEDDQFFEQIESGFKTVFKDKAVMKKLKQLEGELMNALKAQDFDKANQTAISLLDIDERQETVKYLLSVTSELMSDE